MINRKTSIVATLVVMSLIFGGFGFLLLRQPKTENINASRFINLAVNNGLAQRADFLYSKTSKDALVDAKLSIALIEKNINSRVSVIGSNDQISQKVKDAKKLVDQGKYSQAIAKVEESARLLNHESLDYEKENADKMSDITDKVKTAIPSNLNTAELSITNHLIDGDWAAVTVWPKTNNIDITIAILKQQNGIWSIVGGAGTGYTAEDIIGLGAPADFANRAMSLFTNQDLLSQIKV